MSSLQDGKINKKLKPYQALVLLMYGSYEWVEREGTSYDVKLGPFARHIQVPNYRLIEYLKWLEEMGFISELEHTYGRARFVLESPEAVQGGTHA